MLYEIRKKYEIYASYVWVGSCELLNLLRLPHFSIAGKCTCTKTKMRPVCVCVVSSKSYVDGVVDQLGIKCCKAARSMLEVILLLFWVALDGDSFSFWSSSRLLICAPCVPFVQSVRPSLPTSPPPPKFIKRKMSCRGWLLGRFHRRFQSVLSCSSWGGFKPSPPRVRGS
jgi:hypothetical protein